MRSLITIFILLLVVIGGTNTSIGKNSSQDFPSSISELIAIESLTLIIDQDNKLSLEKVMAMDTTTIPQSRFPYLVSKNTIWIVIDPLVFEKLSSEFQLSFIGNARTVNLYYHTEAKQWVSTQYTLNSNSGVDDFYPAFSLPFSEIDKPIYAQLIEPVIPLVVLENKAIAFNRQLKKTIFNSLILGGLLIILFINMFRWVDTREKIFGLYSAYILSFVLIMLAFGGNNMVFLLVKIPPYTKFIIHMAAIFQLNIMACIYAIEFLQLKKTIPILYQVFRFTIWGFCLFYLYLFFDLSYFVSMANFSIVLTLCLLFIGGVLMLKKGHTYITFYVIAYVLFVIFHITYVLIRNYNTPAPYTSPVLISFVGFFIEALLLNISLNHKISFDKKVAELQYKKSQDELFEFHNQQNALLEKKVKERTQELEESNEELRKVEKDLKTANSQVRKRNRELNKTIGMLKKTQTQLIESEKMASLGILSAGIGHEINNPLNFIKGGITGLSRRIKPYLKDDKQTEKFISIVFEGVDRASSIVKSLSDFSRTNSNMEEKCDIHVILENCLVILETKLKHKVKVEKDFSNQKLICKGNVGLLHQAFINVISNAEQAILEQGEISIKTYLEDNRIIVRIADQGIGIEEKHLNKLMDPFFTTKDPGEGTGLGLSITYKIIEDHGGKINIHSEVGKGTTFEVSLPAMP